MATHQLWLVRRWRPALMVVVLLVAMLFGGSLLWYRVMYHSFAFWTAPPRITYCNRDYQTNGMTLTREQIDADPVSLAGDPPYQLSSIRPAIPVLGWTLWAKITPQNRRTELGTPCSMVIYLQQEPDSYLSYGLLGGP